MDYTIQIVVKHWPHKTLELVTLECDEALVDDRGCLQVGLGETKKVVYAPGRWLEYVVELNQKEEDEATD